MRGQRGLKAAHAPIPEAAGSTSKRRGKKRRARSSTSRPKRVILKTIADFRRHPGYTTKGGAGTWEKKTLNTDDPNGGLW